MTQLFTLVAAIAGIVAILSSLSRIERRLTHMAATEQDLQNDMDALKALVQKQNDIIAQQAAGTLISQEQLDALHAEAQAILNPAATTDAPATT